MIFSVPDCDSTIRGAYRPWHQHTWNLVFMVDQISAPQPWKPSLILNKEISILPINFPSNNMESPEKGNAAEIIQKSTWRRLRDNYCHLQHTVAAVQPSGQTTSFRLTTTASWQSGVTIACRSWRKVCSEGLWHPQILRSFIRGPQDGLDHSHCFASTVPKKFTLPTKGQTWPCLDRRLRQLYSLDRVPIRCKELAVV